jgi:Holliday junction resolvasome RuvABC ATP-dependent DNA helicase subunit
LDDAIKLVQFYFDRERERSSLKRVRSGDVKPLSKDILDHVLSTLPANVQKTPRNLIQFLHRLFDYAAQTNTEVIDKELVEQLIKEFGAMKPSQSPLRKRK